MSEPDRLEGGELLCDLTEPFYCMFELRDSEGTYHDGGGLSSPPLCMKVCASNLMHYNSRKFTFLAKNAIRNSLKKIDPLKSEFQCTGSYLTYVPLS